MNLILKSYVQFTYYFQTHLYIYFYAIYFDDIHFYDITTITKKELIKINEFYQL